MRKKVLLSEVLDRYRREVSILKRGYATEKFRLEQLARSSLGQKFAHEVTSVDIATYRDDRLKSINKKTKKILSTSSCQHSAYP